MNREEIKEEQKRRARLIQSYQKVFNTPEGNEVLLDIMDRGNVLKPTFSLDNDVMTHLNEGKRELALYIIEMNQIDLKKLYKMINGEEKGDKNEKEEDDHI